MKEPFLNRLEPWKNDYGKRTKDIVIYECWKSIADQYDMDYDEDDDDGDDEERDYMKYSIHRHDQPQTPTIPLDNMNLQKLIDLIPAGLKPEDIKMRMSINMSDMGPSKNDGQTITFYYTKTFPADIEQYNKDKAAYDLEFKEYEKKKKIYDKWVKDEEIKKLESQLKKLKK